MRYLQIRNWGKYQHYSQRTPPWIKLHLTLMDDFDFQALDERTQRHAFHIMLLAARTENRIPWDEKWVAQRIQAKSKVNLQMLVNNSFLEEIDAASNPLASSAGIRRVEESRQEETRGEEKRFSPAQFVELWKSTQHKETDLTAARREKIRLRLRRHPDKEYWVDVMDTIQQTPFLRGENDREWTPDFDWLIRNDENAAKVREGKYGRRVTLKVDPPNPKCLDCGHPKAAHGENQAGVKMCLIGKKECTCYGKEEFQFEQLEQAGREMC